MKVKWLLLSITVVLTVGLSTAVWAHCDETPVPLRIGQGYGARQGDSQGWMAQLSEEQREQLKTEVGEMREQGASPEEVRDAVGKMLKGWGVEPARGGQGGGMRGYEPMIGDRGGGMGGYGPMMEGRGGGMEGHEPMMGGRGVGIGGYGAGPGWMSQLTPEQRQQIQATIKDMLKKWGIEPPQQGRGYGPMRGGRGGGMQGQGRGE